MDILCSFVTAINKLSASRAQYDLEAKRQSVTDNNSEMMTKVKKQMVE
jgi:hypothetical protein